MECFQSYSLENINIFLIIIIFFCNYHHYCHNLENPLFLPGLFAQHLPALFLLALLAHPQSFLPYQHTEGGILVERVICVAPGHNEFRISVFLHVVHLRFLVNGQIKKIQPSPNLIPKIIFLIYYILVFTLSRRNTELSVLRKC